MLDLKTGATKTLIRGGSQAEYVETGHLIYAAGGTLNAVRFDPVRLEATGEPVPIVEQVLTKANGMADYAVSRQGTLVHVPGGVGRSGSPRTLVWVDRNGHEEPIAASPRSYAMVRLSPDGTRIALDVRDDQRGIWIWNLTRLTMQRLTTGPGAHRWPVWTPDGRRVAFSAEHDGVESVYWQTSDGAGSMERLSIGTQFELPQSFSPDGTRLIVLNNPARPDLDVLTLGATRTASMLLHSTAVEASAEISPDGRWLAYESDESGRVEVYVRPFPNVETARHQISTMGGSRPVWSRDMRELFSYVDTGMIMAVPIQFGADFVPGPPQPVVKGPYRSTDSNGRHYDVSLDGRRFLLMKDAPGPEQHRAAAREIDIAMNWFEELKARVPTK